MKTNLYHLFGAAMCALAVTTPSAIQAREVEDEHHQEIERVINLAPTVNAPASARGVLELEVGHHRSTTNKIEIHAFGLAPGVYSVTVFDRAGANSTVLGSFVSGTSSDDDSEGRDDNSGHHRRGRGGDDNSSHDDDGEGEFTIPASVNAFDLGRISVTDGSGIEVLVGDLSDIASTVGGHVLVRVPVVAGAAEDDASGVASISGHMRRGRGEGKLSVVAGSLPPRTTVHLFINGEDAGIGRTDRHGGLRVRRNHRSLDVFAVSTVSVRDDSGNELLKGQF